MNSNNNVNTKGISGLLGSALLSAPIPIVVLEGMELKVSYANDALFDFWGKDKSILGKTLLEILPEIHDQPFPELLKEVFRTGVTYIAKEALATISKDGNPQTLYCDYSYTAIKDLDGIIVGILVVTVDVTQQVLDRKKTEESNIQLIRARDITAQLNAQAAAIRYTENLKTLNSISKTISGELELEKILQKVTDVTTLLTEAKFGAFFYKTINANQESLMLYTLSGAPREAFEKFGTPRNTDVFNHTFSGLGVMRIDDITKDSRYGKNYPHHGMPDGHLPVVSYLAVPVVSKTGEVIGGLFFGHPEAGMFTMEHENIVIAIASQAAIAIDNAKLYEEVKTLNAKKDEFIGLASHELKTPLTSISGYMQILERTQTEEKSRKFVVKTLQQVRKLTSLVSDLLDVSKIEAGKLQLVKEKFDIVDVLHETIELIYDSTYSNHQVSLETTIDHLNIYGDKIRIEQVIINLLTNAIKYSPSTDQVQVMLTTANNEIVIGVKDGGIGIPEDKLKQIFSRFFRVDGLSPHMSGLGIGLYISQEIIERHNGKIWAESELNKGSTFWVMLPISDQTTI